MCLTGTGPRAAVGCVHGRTQRSAGGGRGAREDRGEMENGREWIKKGGMGQRREKKFRSSVENFLGEHHKVLLTK